MPRLPDPPPVETDPVATVELEELEARVEAIEAAGGAAPYVHDQGPSSATWVVAHGFGRFPSAVSVIDTAGTVVYGRIHHDSVDQLTLTFSAAFSGKALVTP